MSRLYLVFFAIFSFSGVYFGQSELSKYLKYADEQYQKGDFYYALDYYQKAMEIDSQSVSILWSYAETLRAYKDYEKAEFYYGKVYQKEEANIYPASLLQYGLMQKQNGKYDEALETFKKAKKKYARDKKGYLYQKSRREIESCLWAKDQFEGKYPVKPMDNGVNSDDAEFGHLILGETIIFSALKADSISSQEQVYDKNYSTHLYQKSLSDSTRTKPELIKDLYIDKMSTGNGTFSLDSSRYYFSLCSQVGHEYRCKIMVANYRKGKWFSVDSLGTIINEAGSNSTMPCIANWENKEILIFASDRSGTEGGLDLWYSEIKNGNQFSKVRNIKNLNTLDNETSPWWDDREKKLYFSSSWFDGLGGLDIFSSEYDGKLNDPVNMGKPYNSPANDLYFFKNANKDYLTSNRLGVNYAKNPTCCSDIFYVELPEIEKPITRIETLAELSKRLPVTLYFHNDVPNPRSALPTTEVNYINSYVEYREMLDKYQKEYSMGLTGEKADDAKEDIESFFLEYVDQGVKDLNQFRDLLIAELEKGAKINLTIKGFASPLAKSDYNVNLTKRRIASLINYLNGYENGVFKPYISQTATNGGKLTFSEIPFGEYTANTLVSDNLNDQKNSVYSRAAGLERKIEIQSIQFIKDSIVDLPLFTEKNIQDLGLITSTTKVSVEFSVKNTNNHRIELLPPRSPCDCSVGELSKSVLEPGESTKVKVTFDPSNYEGKVVKSIYLKSKFGEEEIRLILTGTVDSGN
jgi:tetratricopeptide (TPR) repeat protein